MRKIPTIFVRDPENMSRLTNWHHPDCEWVFAGEGLSTLKIDGMCAAILRGKLVKRREVKKSKPEPDGFILADRDEVTGKTVGWVPVGNGPGDQYFREASMRLDNEEADGTLELVGPKIQGGREGAIDHRFIRHDTPDLILDDPPERTRDAIRAWLTAHPWIEGIVWHHPDGRMAKIKSKDFGITWRERSADESSTA